MAMSPQAVVFGIQSIMRLGNAARRAYQDKVLDSEIIIPDLDIANLAAPRRALQIVEDGIRSGQLTQAQWEQDFDLVSNDDTSPAGLAAQVRIVNVAIRLDSGFATASEHDGLNVLAQWSTEANRQTPLGRIGIELADIALDYVGANPALFGVDGNGARLVTSVAASLSELLPDPDNPAAPGVNFASGAIRIFVEAGLRAVNNNVDKYIDEAHLQDVATSILDPLIKAVAEDTGTSNQPWYDLRDEFLGPITEAAIDALARNQVAILGKDFELDSKVGALTQSVLVSIKDSGLGDDFSREGLIRIYNSMLDTVIGQPGVFLGDASSEADQLVKKLMVDTAQQLKNKSPPFDKTLAVELIASSFETVSANAAVLVADVDAGAWTETVADLSEAIIREVSQGIADGLSSGDIDLMQRLFNQEQAAEFMHIIVEDIATTPGMLAGDESPELRALVEIVARAMAQQKGQLFSADNWLDVVSIAAREVAANPGRLVDAGEDNAERQILFKLISAVMGAAADAADQGRAGGNVLFGDLLVEAVRTVIETAAGNALKASGNVEELQEFVDKLAKFAMSNKESVGKQEWLFLFRKYIAQVLDTGELPSLEAEDLLRALLER